MAYFYLILAFLFNGSANFLFKLGASKGIDFHGLSPWKLLIYNYLVILGLVGFVLNALFYVLALRSLTLSVAYPIMVAMSFLLVNTLAFFFLGERLNFIQGLGYVFLIFAISLILFGASKA